MRYSALGGGKRLRGVMAMAAAGAVGGREEHALPVAAAVEMIHAYSLIHDDLPCMDDDDLRRGKPTCHRVFGEAMAVLAGDALMTHAFLVLADLPRSVGLDAQRALRIVRELAWASSRYGLVGGQVVDLESEGPEDLPEERRNYIHSHKTGALFSACLVGGGIAGGGREEDLEALREYGRHFGLAFQITDDLLNVTGTEAQLGKPVGSDARRKKATYVTLYGVDGARRRAEDAVEQAKGVLNRLPSTAAREFLADLAQFVLARDH